MKNSWTTRWLTKNDLQKMEDFRLGIEGVENFPDYATKEFYEWKYFGGPVRPALVRIAVADGEIVGSLAATIKKIKIKDDIILCAEFGDGSTRRDYRKKGIFSTLGRELIEGLEEAGVQLIYGRPNDESYPPLVNNLGFKNVVHLRPVRRVINVDNILKRKLKNRLLYNASKPLGYILTKTAYRINEYRGGPDVDITETAAFGDDIDKCFAEVSGDYDVMVMRDKAYLNWRYADNPTKYEIYVAKERGVSVGFAIVTCVEMEDEGRTNGYLVDIMTKKSHADATNGLINRAMQYFARERVDCASTWIVKGSSASTDAYHRALEDNGFAPVGDDLHFIVRTDLPEIEKALSEVGPSGWFFRFGDTDGI